MSKAEERRTAITKEAHRGLSSFLLLDRQEVFFNRREKVLEVAAPAKALGGRTNELIDRLEAADRPNKFEKAIRVLKDHLRTMATGSAKPMHSTRKTPRLSPHHHQSLPA